MNQPKTNIIGRILGFGANPLPDDPKFKELMELASKNYLLVGKEKERYIELLNIIDEKLRKGTTKYRESDA